LSLLLLLLCLSATPTTGIVDGLVSSDGAALEHDAFCIAAAFVARARRGQSVPQRIGDHLRLSAQPPASRRASLDAAALAKYAWFNAKAIVVSDHEEEEADDDDDDDDEGTGSSDESSRFDSFV
jgi:hypothetical protein